MANINQIKSIAFPFSMGSSSFPAMTSDVSTAISSSIKSLLLTAKNERVMRNNFGSNAHALVFENFSPILQARISADTKKTIEENEPRVTVLVVDATQTPQEESAIMINVLYQLGGQTVDQQIPI